MPQKLPSITALNGFADDMRHEKMLQNVGLWAGNFQLTLAQDSEGNGQRECQKLKMDKLCRGDRSTIGHPLQQIVQ